MVIYFNAENFTEGVYGRVWNTDHQSGAVITSSEEFAEPQIVRQK
jgi:hypothetical protein